MDLRRVAAALRGLAAALEAEPAQQTMERLPPDAEAQIRARISAAAKADPDMALDRCPDCGAWTGWQHEAGCPRRK